VFDPPDLPAQPLDQIFWTNNDPDEAHWPGLLDDEGNIDKTFFMPNQIAPNGDVSATFAPTAAATFKYACSLHPEEQGTITVT
jgi:plastocyanin